nr:NAD-binding protein [Campylobacter sp.]
MKIAIIGAGNVGSALANLLIAKKMCKKVTLIDINKNLALGKAI